MTLSDKERAEFRERKNLAELTPRAAADLFAVAVDDAWDRRDLDTLRHVTEVLAPTVDRSSGNSSDLSDFDYCLANAWHGIKIFESGDLGGGWDWESRSVEQEVICLRRASRIESLCDQPLGRVCQIYTNLANCYSTTGRAIDAVWNWDQALRIEPSFGMARGNRGVGLWTYAKSQYDHRHAMILAREAWNSLCPESLGDVEQGAVQYFESVRAEIESALPIEFLTTEIHLDDFSLGKTDAETKYRAWCLRQRAFLNPLNELGEVAVAARDVLSCPSVVAQIGEGPRFHDFMNQIKQEFCSARWFVYEATGEHPQHFADSDVQLYNTLDYPSYGLRTEQLKLAFRALYSLFDKVSFFLNAYLDLGIPEKRVSLRGLWYVKQDRKKGIRPEFAVRENWPMRGLYWLSKDLFENTPGFREAMDPLADQMADVRNQLEHKYLKLHSDLWAGPDERISKGSLAKSLARDDFEQMTLLLLRLVRSAIIHLALSVHSEEHLRAKDRDPEEITAPMFIDTWEDDWKS